MAPFVVKTLERFQKQKLMSRIAWKNIELNPKVFNADFEL